MSAIGHLPERWARPAVGLPGRVELTGYLLVPYLVTLPASVVRHYAVIRALYADGAGMPGLLPGSAWLNVLA
ncbi:hypothetical protein I5Q34_24970 [Streptomyces sp. AV19]|uniref:hypothetical protein n=1 Tax=Streptomyces sp. AV19 TaxID=2793068 RepID=UPI0018FEB201|nr:hypothetical protein [Streptomyces sp. AV19]MBH1937483.1 hypothetical protein [Streptomyces sp. AV19]MDG4533744.1 hypothetical protein [Streptomyces sp. AV19]